VYSYNPNRKGLTEVKILGLQSWRLYPGLAELNRDFLLNHAGHSLRVDRETPIASIGSCFAREIKLWLIENGYSYIQAATGPCTESGSARYDRVFNTFSIRQEFERAFGDFEPATKFWQVEEDGRSHLLSPYRYCLAWDSESEMHEELAEHKACLQSVFTSAQVIIITVGQSEIWYDKRDGSVFPMVPPTDIFDPEIHAFRMSTYQENLENLNRSYDLVKENNPDAHILITVSPVPLRATFRQVNSVIADTAGKSMLRAVVDEFVRTHGEDVTYFPAYEVVRCLTDEPWKSDARYVTRDTVASIMSLFEEWFVKESVTLSPLEKYEAAEAAYLGRDFSKAAVLFEELISTVDASSDHEAELTERRWALHERLAMTYYSVQRFGEAYEQLKRAIDLKPTESERWDEVLGNICAMALNQGDYANVPPLLQRLLSNPTAPLSVFFHWLKLLETHRGEAIARTFLSDGLSLAPRVAQHPSFPDYADKYGLAKAS
jgi:tetratricopeptide (TPR) repeat protein